MIKNWIGLTKEGTIARRYGNHLSQERQYVVYNRISPNKSIKRVALQDSIRDALSFS